MKTADTFRERRISEIEQALARPAYEGREWDRERRRLEAELDALRVIGPAPLRCPDCGNTDPALMVDNNRPHGDPEYAMQCIAESNGEPCGMQWEPNA